MNSRTYWMFFPVAALAACLSLSGADTLVIAERGKAAEYSIVIPAKEASPAHKYAAEELRDFT